MDEGSAARIHEMVDQIKNAELQWSVLGKVTEAPKISAVTQGYISSDNWQVVRIVGICSEFGPCEYPSRYDSSTEYDHSGSFLLVATEEQAFQPLMGIIDANATFRYYNATELVQERVDISDGIYTGYRRFWLVDRTITSGDFEFTADYAQQVGNIFNQVHLHRDIYVR